MTPHGDTWTAEYGRVGSSSQRREYPIREWDKKYNEKIKKGLSEQEPRAFLILEMSSLLHSPNSNPKVSRIVLSD